MKILSLLLATLALSVSAQDKPYDLITCFSDSEGWIEVLINKQQQNDQMLRIYSQAGLGPNNLEASYVSTGNNNQLGIDRAGTIYLKASFSNGLQLFITHSEAFLSSNLNTDASVYRNCRFE